MMGDSGGICGAMISGSGFSPGNIWHDRIFLQQFATNATQLSAGRFLTFENF